MMRWRKLTGATMNAILANSQERILAFILCTIIIIIIVIVVIIIINTKSAIPMWFGAFELITFRGDVTMVKERVEGGGVDIRQ
jgi:hypothetical protein